MASILIAGSHGTDDPTRASLPFHLATGAVEAGHRVAVALVADATLIMKDVIADHIVPVGQPPLKELLATAIQNQTPIYV